MFNKKYSPPSGNMNRQPRNNFTRNNIDLGIDMFPELESSIPQKEIEVSDWSNLKKRQEEEIETERLANTKITDINVTNSKYWRNSQWIGPIIIRGNITSSSEVPRSQTEYSRDNIQWYSSLNDLYSKNELEQQRIKDEEENEERITKILDDYSRKLEMASIQYYEDYGEYDHYAQAIGRRHEYEEYVKQFDIPVEVEKELNEYGEEYDYLEEDEY